MVAPDRVELVLDQRRRRRELVQGVELIQQFALELLPAHRGVLARDAILDRVLELLERLQSERLRELLVDGDLFRRLDRFGGDVELGGFAGERLGRVALREGHLDHAGFAGAKADELLFEARDELVRADRHGDVVAGAAGERGAVDAADEVDHHAVAVLDLGALGLRLKRFVLLGDLLERVVDLAVGDLGDQLFQLDGAEVGERDRRQHLERQRVGEVGLAADDAVDLGLLVRDRDFRLARKPQPPLLDDLRVELADHGLDRLRHHRAAIDLAQMRHRHLAGTEAAHLHAALQLGEPPCHPRFEVGGRHRHLEFALETVGNCFCDLHGFNDSAAESGA